MVSISIYSTGSFVGETGQTCFHPSGKSHILYNDENLIRHGDIDGYNIAMTDHGYITLESREEITHKMSKGIINLPIIIYATTIWWVLNIVDRFGPHTDSLKSMENYSE